MPVIVSSFVFDTAARPVVVSFVEFDTQALSIGDGSGDKVEPSPSIGGSRARTSAASRSKSSPATDSSRYHGRSDEQAELALAAELADEETVLTFILELAHYGVV